MKEWDLDFELVDPNEIVVDHRYQRAPKPDLIAAIGENLNWGVFGVIVCSRRSSGKLYCLDGQQRLAGAMSAPNPPSAVPCVIKNVGSVKEEAAYFSVINEARRNVFALEKYKAHLVAEDPAYVQINRAVEAAGYTVAGNSSASDSRSISAIAGLLDVYNMAGEQGVYEVMIAIRQAWPDEAGATVTWIIRALGEVVTEEMSNGEIDHDAIVKKMERTTPSRILRKAEEMRFEMGGSKRTNVRRAFKALAKL